VSKFSLKKVHLWSKLVEKVDEITKKRWNWLLKKRKNFKYEVKMAATIEDDGQTVEDIIKK
jgi:hypothetical protein